MISLLIGILIAAIVYLLLAALGLPHIIAVIAALLVVVVALAEGFGGGRYRRW